MNNRTGINGEVSSTTTTATKTTITITPFCGVVGSEGIASVLHGFLDSGNRERTSQPSWCGRNVFEAAVGAWSSMSVFGRVLKCFSQPCVAKAVWYCGCGCCSGAAGCCVVQQRSLGGVGVTVGAVGGHESCLERRVLWSGTATGVAKVRSELTSYLGIFVSSLPLGQWRQVRISHLRVPRRPC